MIEKWQEDNENTRSVVKQKLEKWSQFIEFEREIAH